MFNLNRFKARLKADIRGVKKYFSKDKNVAPVVIDKPKVKISKRAIARLKQKQIAEHYALLRRKHYVGGQCSRLGHIKGRTDFSASAEHHRARVAGREETRERLRIAKRLKVAA